MNKQTAERLKSSLDDTRAILENAIQEYRKEMNDHRKILKKQNRYIEVSFIYTCLYSKEFISFLNHYN